MKKIYLVLVIVLTGCTSMLPHTKKFEPGGPQEKMYFDLSDGTIFPDDVRKDPKKYSKVIVSWTGVIESVEFDEASNDDTKSFWIFRAKHHYYDWLLDYSIQREKFFLSPKGEGKFTVIVPVKKYGANAENFKKQVLESFAKGDMIVAYGTPDKVENESIRLSNGFANSVPARYFSTKYLTYDRVPRR